MPHRVLIIEDERMPRALLELYVDNSPQYCRVASVSSADMAMAFCENRVVDLIIMDVLTERGANGLDVSQEIKKRFPHIKIIILTSMPEVSWLKRARSIGVDSFCYKEFSGENILSIMDKTMAGERIFPDMPPRVPIGLSDSLEFTDREIAVLRELLTGNSNAEIAEKLGITPETVKFHVTQMLQKTGFHTRTELATQARAVGIVIN